MAGHKKLVSRHLTKMATDLAAVRSGAAGDALCPLCLRPFMSDALSERRPTLEHIIQRSLGGMLTSVTCVSCNNGNGARLDVHLSKAMSALDFLEGKGTAPAAIKNDVGHVAANIELNLEETVKINVLGETASNVAAVAMLPTLLRENAKISFTLNFGFIPESYWRAILRTAYLVAFAHFGYAYALSAGGAQVREVLNGGQVSNNVILEAFPSADPGSVFLTHAIDVFGFLVVFRLRSLKTRWIAVLLPGTAGCAWDLLGEVTEHAGRRKLLVVKKDPVQNFTVRFGQEPVKRLENLTFSSAAPHEGPYILAQRR